MVSKVYFMDARSFSPQTSLIAKMIAVFNAASFEKLIKPGDVVAIKLHCGEWNNTAYLRPVYARTIADKVKSLGGRPFVCDTVTLPYSLYPSRSTGLDLMVTAERNGYNSATLGCPFIIADGFMGTDDYHVDLPEGYLLKEAYIAEGIAAADVLITLSISKVTVPESSEEPSRILVLVLNPGEASSVSTWAGTINMALVHVFIIPKNLQVRRMTKIGGSLRSVVLLILSTLFMILLHGKEKNVPTVWPAPIRCSHGVSSS